jgi:hypothetical protein
VAADKFKRSVSRFRERRSGAKCADDLAKGKFGLHDFYFRSDQSKW